MTSNQTGPDSRPTAGREAVGLDLRPSGEGAGAEVAGVDLSAPLPDDMFARIDHALADHGVLVFREQRLPPERQLAFCERFGRVEVNAFDQYALPGHPGVLVVSNIVEDGRSIGYADAGSHWHTDMSYTATPAPMHRAARDRGPERCRAQPRGYPLCERACGLGSTGRGGAAAHRGASRRAPVQRQGAGGQAARSS